MKPAHNSRFAFGAIPLSIGFNRLVSFLLLSFVLRTGGLFHHFHRPVPLFTLCLVGENEENSSKQTVFRSPLSCPSLLKVLYASHASGSF